MSEFNCIEYQDFKDADEFVDYLNPLGEHWGKGTRSPWIFRGQSDASWGLIPKAWREEIYPLLRPIMNSLETCAEENWEGLYKQYGMTKDYDKKDVIEVLSHTAAVFELTNSFAELAG